MQFHFNHKPLQSAAEAFAFVSTEVEKISNRYNGARYDGWAQTKAEVAHLMSALESALQVRSLIRDGFKLPYTLDCSGDRLWLVVEPEALLKAILGRL